MEDKPKITLKEYSAEVAKDLISFVANYAMVPAAEEAVKAARSAVTIGEGAARLEESWLPLSNRAANNKLKDERNTILQLLGKTNRHASSLAERTFDLAFICRYYNHLAKASSIAPANRILSGAMAWVRPQLMKDLHKVRNCLRRQVENGVVDAVLAKQQAMQRVLETGSSRHLPFPSGDFPILIEDDIANLTRIKDQLEKKIRERVSRESVLADAKHSPPLGLAVSSTPGPVAIEQGKDQSVKREGFEPTVAASAAAGRAVSPPTPWWLKALYGLAAVVIVAAVAYGGWMALVGAGVLHASSTAVSTGLIIAWSSAAVGGLLLLVQGIRELRRRWQAPAEPHENSLSFTARRRDKTAKSKSTKEWSPGLSPISEEEVAWPNSPAEPSLPPYARANAVKSSSYSISANALQHNPLHEELYEKDAKPDIPSPTSIKVEVKKLTAASTDDVATATPPDIEQEGWGGTLKGMVKFFAESSRKYPTPTDEESAYKEEQMQQATAAPKTRRPSLLQFLFQPEPDVKTPPSVASPHPRAEEASSADSAANKSLEKTINNASNLKP
jgi:hypothetical protein